MLKHLIVMICPHARKDQKSSETKRHVKQIHPSDTVDGSEIPFPTTWDGAYQTRRK